MKKFNYDEFLKRIDETQEGYEHKVFEKELTDFLVEYIPTNILKGTRESHDKGVDAVYYVKGANKLTLFQFKLGKTTAKISQEDLDNIQNKVKKFLKDPRNNDNNDENLSEVSANIHRGKILEVDLIVFTTKTFMKGVNKGMEAENKESLEIDGKTIKMSSFFLDKDMFFEMIHYLKTNNTFNETIKGKSMRFDLKPGNYIEHSKGEGYTVMVNARSLYNKVMDIIGSPRQIAALTHKNVRDFLGSVDEEDSENISNGILKTLTDPKEGQDLYAYHMGMVVLCENLQVNDSSDKLVIFSPSFVNGAQSLGTLLRANLNDINEHAAFTIRFIKAQSTSEETKIFSDKIVIRTNSSNPITPQMRYAFDPKQSQIARLFEDRGYYYDYRAAEVNRKDTLKKLVEKTASIIDFSDNSEFTKFPIKKEIKPDDVAAAIFAINENDYNAPRGNKQIFRYSSNLDAKYYDVFYDEGKLRSFKEYFVPVALHDLLLREMKSEFTTRKDAVTINWQQKLFKLDFNQSKKIQWLFYLEFMKSINVHNLKELVKVWSETEKPFDWFKSEVKRFLKETNNDLSEIGSPKTSIKKLLIDKKVTNLADIAR